MTSVVHKPFWPNPHGSALDWPLMHNNITRNDRLTASNFLLDADRLTNGKQVADFEREFANWLGVRHAVMVNSGSSANLITMQVVRSLHGPGRVLVPCITWVSDVAAVLHAGLEPVFCDIDPTTLGMVIPRLNSSDVVFRTHCLGFSAGPSFGTAIEDCCEALGATHDGKKLGTFGWMSNFSFYYGHHLTTIEGGMVCTDDNDAYQMLLRLRSHGMTREMKPSPERSAWAWGNKSLDPSFIFAEPAYNVRSTEVNAVIGRNQLKRIDANVDRRTANLMTWIYGLGPRYRTNYRIEGSSNFALPLVLVEPDPELFATITQMLGGLNVEYRKGLAGGGNQLRQPYAKVRWGEDYHKQFPEAEHISDFGLYIGNYPSLPNKNIETLCGLLNEI